MAEIKYEHPLEYYTVENFVKDSRKLIGEKLLGMPGTYDKAKYDFIMAYSMALGDDNPLYTDLDYAFGTKYDSLIAPPTFLITIKYPILEGALYNGPYPLAGTEAEFDWEWNDVTRVNDRFTTELTLKDVYEKTSDKGRMVYLVSECKYWNKVSNELVATCHGTYAALARAESITEIPEAIRDGFRKQPVTDRKVHYHTEEEVKRLVKEILGMVRRGDKPLYWERVNVGDQLNPVVKAPLTTGYLVSYVNATFSAQAFPNFELHYKKWAETPGAFKGNPSTGWPYDIEISQHVDPNMSEAGGMPNEYGWGTLKAGFAMHLLSNWIGDEGFIRKMKVDVIEPYIYGDALWLKGEVVDKYKEKISGESYNAVDIKLEAVNQESLKVITGSSTVYLPSTDSPVKLPILQTVR